MLLNRKEFDLKTSEETMVKLFLKHLWLTKTPMYRGVPICFLSGPWKKVKRNMKIFSWHIATMTRIKETRRLL